MISWIPGSPTTSGQVRAAGLTPRTRGMGRPGLRDGVRTEPWRSHSGDLDWDTAPTGRSRTIDPVISSSADAKMAGSRPASRTISEPPPGQPDGRPFLSRAPLSAVGMPIAVASSPNRNRAGNRVRRGSPQASLGGFLPCVDKPGGSTSRSDTSVSVSALRAARTTLLGRDGGQCLTTAPPAI